MVNSRGRIESKSDASKGPGSAKKLTVENISIRNLECVVFDLETTGGNPEKNGITEICALRVKDGRIIDRYHTLVNPKIPIPPIVRRMTGIDNAMVKDAPTIDLVMPDFLKFMGDSIVVAHNTIGDLKFVRYFAEKTVNLNFDNYYICTHLLSEKLMHDSKDKSLKGLSKQLGFIARGKNHRAEADAYLTVDLLNHLITLLHAAHVTTICDVLRLQGDFETLCRLGWSVLRKDLTELPKELGVLSFFDRRNKMIYATSCTDMRREAHYFSNLASLPKQLAKVLIHCKRIESQVCTDMMAAMQYEEMLFWKEKFFLNPARMHQRSVQSVVFKTATGKVPWLEVSPLDSHNSLSFGPIHDARIATERCKAINKILAEECSGVATEVTDIVSSFLEGDLENKLPKFTRTNWALRAIDFITGKYKLNQTRVRVAIALSKLGSPKLTAFQNLVGHLVINHSNLGAGSGRSKSNQLSKASIYEIKHGKVRYLGSAESPPLEDLNSAVDLAQVLRNLDKTNVSSRWEQIGFAGAVWFCTIGRREFPARFIASS